MNLTKRSILQYCEAHSTPQSEVLYELERETHLKTLAPQMLSGHLQGQLLRFLSRLARPRHALEIGTFTGYGAICIAEGLTEGGQLHNIEANPELEYIIRKYFDKAGLSDRIHLHLGPAEEVLPTLPYPWDFAFIDAAKQDYDWYYEAILDQLRPGGLLLADNVLWSGKVVGRQSGDEDAAALHAFNQKVQADERVENLMLPVRDGLLIVRKKER